MNRITPLLFVLSVFGIVIIGGLSLAYGWRGAIAGLIGQTYIYIRYRDELFRRY